MEGYRGIYLRTYFPAEFIVGYLNSAKGIEDVQKGDSLAHSLDISYLNESDVRKRKAEIISSLSNKKINEDDLPTYPDRINIHPPTFGKSKGEYSVDSKTYAIYKGIGSIKGLNKNLADELFNISNDNKYQNIESLNESDKLALFYDLLKDIKINTSLNKKQLEILIKLNYFRMFGGNKTLLDIQQNVLNITKRSQYNKNELEFVNVNRDIFLKYVGNETKSLYKEIDYDGYYHEWVKTLENESIPISEQLEYENEYIGSFILQIDSEDPYYYILDMKTYNNPNKPYVHLYNLSTGDILYGKIIDGEYYSLNKFHEKSVLSNLAFHETIKKKKLPDGTMIDSDEKIAVFDKWNLIAA